MEPSLYQYFTCFGRLVNQTGIYHYIILLSFKNEIDTRVILILGSLHRSISISRRHGSYFLPNLFSETLVSLKLLFLPPPAGHSKTRYAEDLFSFVILSSEEKGRGRPHPDLTIVCASFTTSWEWHAWQMPPSCQCDSSTWRPPTGCLEGQAVSTVNIGFTDISSAILTLTLGRLTLYLTPF